MGFRSLKSWFKGLLCISGGSTESQWDWRDDHYDETLNEQDLLDLQETIESHPGLLILQGHQLRKYEERLAGLARIYQRTAALPCPKDEGYAPARAFPEGIELCRAMPQAVGEITEISVTATGPHQMRPTFETVYEEEPILRPLHLADDINHLESEVVASFSPKHLARGSVKLEGRKSSLSERSKIHSAPAFPPALLRRTQSVTGSSDFYAEEVQTPCQPGMSPSGDSLSDASPPPPSLSPRIDTTSSLDREDSFNASRQHLETLGTAFSPFHDKQPLHVTVSKDYDVIQGQKPSRPLSSGDPLQDELLFHSDGPPLSPNSETVRRVTSAYNRERASPEWKVKNAVFAAADIRATSDSAGSMWEDDNLTRLIPEKVESSKLVFDKGCA